jgi:hypothetical protein
MVKLARSVRGHQVTQQAISRTHDWSGFARLRGNHDRAGCVRRAVHDRADHKEGSVTIRDRAAVVLALILLMALGAAMVLIEPARAQSGERGDGHAANHDWYRSLKTKSGWSCCSGDEGHGDCRPVQAHQRQDGEWEAYFSGAWQEIPSDAILRDELNRVPLHAHICERAGFVYCFLRGGEGT